MKEDSDIDAFANEDRIDELLNGFIDDELTARQRTEVERLIAHDEGLEERLAQFQKCRTLVRSLPRAEAPACVLQGIRASLAETSTSPLLEKDACGQRTGRIHLLGRRVLSAAAMITLVGILAGVIYTIVAPHTDSNPQAFVANEEPSENPDGAGSAPATVTGPGFNGRLVLRTGVLAQVDAVINTAIKENGLSDTLGDVRKPNERIHYVKCSRDDFNSLLAGLTEVWPNLDSARLLVDTEVFARQVEVDNITTDQMVSIIDQDTPAKRVSVARDFSILNNAAARLPGREVASAIEGEWPTLVTTPRPMLTGGNFAPNKKPTSRNEEEKTVRLTITVSR